MGIDDEQLNEPENMAEKSNDPRSIREAVEARVKADLIPLDKAPEITPAEILAASQNGAKGPAGLFIKIHGKKFIFNASLGRPLVFRETHYQVDVLNEAGSAVEFVALVFDDEFGRLEEEAQEALQKKEADKNNSLRFLIRELKRVSKKLRSPKGIQDLLSMVWLEPGMSFREEDFNRDLGKIATPNAVVDVELGRGMAGREDLLLTKCTGADVDFAAPRTKFELFLKTALPSAAVILFLQVFLGAALLGLNLEHRILLFIGKGRNGKSLLIELLLYVLGDLARPVSPSLLMEETFARSAGQAQPELLALKDRRFIFAGESDEHHRLSASKVKSLTGGDTQSARAPHAPFDTVFRPIFTLVLSTNFLPRASADDPALWARILVVDFPFQFVDNPTAVHERLRNKHLLAELKIEASGILAWLIEGAILYQRDGLHIPPEVISRVQDYRQAEDFFGEFLEVCCEEATPADRVQFSDIYKLFEAWFLAHQGDRPPKKRRFSTLMERRFKKERTGGKIYFCGLKLRPEVDFAG